MASRTTRKTVSFHRPFVLGDFNEVLPAGNYVVETEEELLSGLSFLAYRRVVSMIEVPETRNKQVNRMLMFAPEFLDIALEHDQALHEQSLKSLPLNEETSAICSAENEGMVDHSPPR